MWKYKFVHRDVSTGNILWDPSTQTGRLSDLEFMKKTTSKEPSGCEVKTVRYIFFRSIILFHC